MCNQEDIPILQPSEQAGISQIVITEEMVRAGVMAYLSLATHDEQSWATPEEVVAGVLMAGLSGSSAMLCGRPVPPDPNRLV